MRRITLSWEDWRAVIAVLRAKALALHAGSTPTTSSDSSSRTAPMQATVTLSLTDDVLPAVLQLGTLAAGYPAATGLSANADIVWT